MPPPDTPAESPPPAPDSEAPSGARVPLSIKVAYGAPGVAGAAMAIPIAIHLSIFYSDVVLVPLGFVALVKALARAFDAFTDPLMGWITDRTRTRWGRRRPWIAVGAPTAALAFIAMFAPPEWLTVAQAAAWFAVTYTLYYLFHTVYQIPHYGLGPEITQDHRERASLFGWSEGFSVAGTLVAAVSPPILARALGSERAAFVAFAILFGVLLTLLYWNLCWRVRERADYLARKPNPLVPGMRRVMRNRVFRVLLAIYLIGSITGAIPGTMMPFFNKYVIQPENPEIWLGIFLAVYFGTAFLFIPVWVGLVKRFGKKPVWVASFVSSIVGLLAIFVFVGEGDVVPMCLLLALTGSTFSARLILSPAIQADVIDYDELCTGKRREAQYGGLWSLMTKFTVIPSMSIPLAVLASLGYEPNVEQGETVRFAIAAIFTLAPAATAAIALPLAIRYPIDERVHSRILEGIAQHGRGEDALDPLTGHVIAPPRESEIDEDRSWFLDHFSMRELRRLREGASVVTNAVAACAASILVSGAAGAILYQRIDMQSEPGLLEVSLILVCGICFAAFTHHSLRVLAALRARRDPPTPEEIDEHVAVERRTSLGAGGG